MTVNTDDYVPEPSWVGRIMECTRLYRRTVLAALDEAGFGDIPINASAVLGALARRPTTAGQLADGLSRAKQEVSRLVDTLVDRDYVVRESDPDDRRRLVLRLSRKGQAAAAVVHATVLTLDQRMEAELAGRGLNADQIERVGRALDEFARR